MRHHTSKVIERVSKDARISKTQATKALDELYRWVSAKLEKRDAVEIGGFGTFIHAEDAGKALRSRRVLPDSQIVFIPKGESGDTASGKKAADPRKDMAIRRQATTAR